MCQHLVILLPSQNFKWQQTCYLLGQRTHLWGRMTERQNTATVSPCSPGVSFWKHTSLSVFGVQALLLPVGNLSHVPFKTGLMSPSLQILLSHGVSLPYHPCCPSSSLQMLLFSVVLATTLMPRPEVWLGLVDISCIFNHPATLNTPFLGACLSPRKKPELASQSSPAAKVWAYVPAPPITYNHVRWWFGSSAREAGLHCSHSRGCGDIHHVTARQTVVVDAEERVEAWVQNLRDKLVVGRIMVFQRWPGLNLQNLNMNMWPHRADVIKLRILGCVLDYLGGFNVIRRVLWETCSRVRIREDVSVFSWGIEGNVMMRAEVREAKRFEDVALLALKMRRGLEPRNAGSL